MIRITTANYKGDELKLMRGALIELYERIPCTHGGVNCLECKHKYFCTDVCSTIEFLSNRIEEKEREER